MSVPYAMLEKQSQHREGWNIMENENPQDDLRQTFLFDQHYAQLEARWPEYVEGRTSHFTRHDWALIDVELGLQAEAANRRRHERRVNLVKNLAIGAVMGALLIMVVVWALPVLVAGEAGLLP